jgi:hypothetical protein
VTNAAHHFQTASSFPAKESKAKRERQEVARELVWSEGPCVRRPTCVKKQSTALSWDVRWYLRLQLLQQVLAHGPKVSMIQVWMPAAFFSKWSQRIIHCHVSRHPGFGIGIPRHVLRSGAACIEVQDDEGKRMKYPGLNSRVTMSRTTPASAVGCLFLATMFDDATEDVRALLNPGRPRARRRRLFWGKKFGGDGQLHWDNLTRIARGRTCARSPGACGRIAPRRAMRRTLRPGPMERVLAAAGNPAASPPSSSR